jgi:hypothetical protein
MNPDTSPWHTPASRPQAMKQSLIWSSPSASLAFDSSPPLGGSDMDDSAISMGYDDGPEPSSRLKANGHLGLLKRHREVLKHDLEASRMSASSFRRLAFRLAAQITTRDAQSSRIEQRLAEARLAAYLESRVDGNMISKLKRTISVYDDQGRALLDQLREWNHEVEDISGTQICCWSGCLLCLVESLGSERKFLYSHHFGQTYSHSYSSLSFKNCP